MTVKSVHTCHDPKCTLGITGCVECNGFGRVNPKGKRYRRQENIPAWAVDHGACNGTGLVVCSERRSALSADERKTLGLPLVARTRKTAAAAA